eukprot:9488385-Pyramimonas_sp.AAC.1
MARWRSQPRRPRSRQDGLNQSQLEPTKMATGALLSHLGAHWGSLWLSSTGCEPYLQISHRG